MTRKPAQPVAGATALYLKITVGKRSQLYRLVNLEPDLRVANPAWRLFKDPETFYDVHVDGRETSCTCPDFIVRRKNQDKKGCKHIAAVRAVGLLRQLRVVREETA